MLCGKIKDQSKSAQNFSRNASHSTRCVVPSDVKYACDLNPCKEKSQQDRSRYFFQKSQEAGEKRESDFAERELESMLPFKHRGASSCCPVEDCSSKLEENPKELRKNKFCPIENRSSELERALQGKYGAFRGNDASDKANLARLRGIMLHDYKKQYPEEYRISNALPHLPFPWLGKSDEGYKNVTDYLYKTTTQLAYEVAPFDKSVFAKRYYPLSTLEKSADPFLVPNYKRIVLSNARKDPSPNNEEGKDRARKLTFSECVDPTKPSPDSLERGGVEKLSKAEDNTNELKQCRGSSVAQHRRMQVAAFKEEIAKRHEAEMMRRINDPPCDLPGTYVGRIGTAVPPDWQPRDPPTEAERRNKEKTVWERATDLPKPTCLCYQKCTMAENECS